MVKYPKRKRSELLDDLLRPPGEIVRPDGETIDPTTAAATTAAPGQAPTTQPYYEFQADADAANRRAWEAGGQYTRTGEGGRNLAFQPTGGATSGRLWMERVRPPAPQPKMLAKAAPQPKELSEGTVAARLRVMAEYAQSDDPAKMRQVYEWGKNDDRFKTNAWHDLDVKTQGGTVFPKTAVEKTLELKERMDALRLKYVEDVAKFGVKDANERLKVKIAQIRPTDLHLDGLDRDGNPDPFEEELLRQFNDIRLRVDKGKLDPKTALELIERIRQRADPDKRVKQEAAERKEQEKERKAEEKERKVEQKAERVEREKTITIKLGDAKEDMDDAKTRVKEIQAEIKSLRKERYTLTSVTYDTGDDPATKKAKKLDESRLKVIGWEMERLEGGDAVIGELSHARDALKTARDAYATARQERNDFRAGPTDTAAETDTPTDTTIPAGSPEAATQPATQPAPTTQPTDEPTAIPGAAQPGEITPEIPQVEPGRNDWREKFPAFPPLGLPREAQGMVTDNEGERGLDGGMYWKNVTGPGGTPWHVGKLKNGEWIFKDTVSGDQYTIDKKGRRWHIPLNGKRKPGWLSSSMMHRYMDEAAKKLGADAPVAERKALAVKLSKGLDK